MAEHESEACLQALWRNLAQANCRNVGLKDLEGHEAFNLSNSAVSMCGMT